MSDTELELTQRRARRWAAVTAERERLLAISRRRTMNAHDAEDCVQEALLRSVEFDGLDEDRIGPFLTTVTMRLCADQHRARQRQDRLDRRIAARRAEEPGPEEAVCDRDEAAWLAGSLRGMPARQQQVIEARMEGLSDAEIAARLGVSYSSVASALARARSAIRVTLATGCVWVVALLRRPRAVALTTATAAAVAVAITTTSPVVTAPVPRALPPVPAPPRNVAVNAPDPVPVPVVVPVKAPPLPRRRLAAAAPAPRPTSRPIAEAGDVEIEERETGRTLPQEIDYCLRNFQINVPGEIGCPE